MGPAVEWAVSAVASGVVSAVASAVVSTVARGMVSDIVTVLASWAILIGAAGAPVTQFGALELSCRPEKVGLF